MAAPFRTLCRVCRATAAAVLLLTGLHGSAAAYCRTTTCSDEAIPGGLEMNSCQVDPDRLGPNCEAGNCCLVVIWRTPCVSFSIDTSTLRPDQVDEIRATVTRAFKTWMSTPCPGTRQPPVLTLRDAFGPVLCGHAEYNSNQGNANIITFRKDWPYDPIELGHTVVTYIPSSGEIVDADIEMNADADFTETGFDLESVLTHEAGHFLGISHTDKPGLSIMPRIYEDPSERYRALRPDDIDALCAMYETKVVEDAVCDFTPRKGFVAECAFDPSSGGWCAARPARLPDQQENLAWFAGLLGAAAALRRRRRKPGR